MIIRVQHNQAQPSERNIFEENAASLDALSVIIVQIYLAAFWYCSGYLVPLYGINPKTPKIIKKSLNVT